MDNGLKNANDLLRGIFSHMGNVGEQYTHDLGNLTLTKHNSVYSNKPFPEKKDSVSAQGHCYVKSPLFVERELTQWNDWDTDAVDKRRSMLLEWARNRWQSSTATIHPQRAHSI